MATFHVDIVAAEGQIFSGEAEAVFAPAIEGELGILPRHAPLLTKLKAGAQPDIYFSFESETGATEWLFCDDSRVIAASGSPPAFEAAAALKKKPKDKPYLDSAAKYPASDVQRAPKGPKKPGATDDGLFPADGGSAWPADGGMPDAGTST